jgi:hypothetical protein
MSVIARSGATGNAFTISYTHTGNFPSDAWAADAQWSATCTTPGTGMCPESGVWEMPAYTGPWPMTARSSGRAHPKGLYAEGDHTSGIEALRQRAADSDGRLHTEGGYCSNGTAFS